MNLRRPGAEAWDASNGGDGCLIRQGGQVFRRKPAIHKRFSQGARVKQLWPR
jgi:hypothetical protein